MQQCLQQTQGQIKLFRFSTLLKGDKGLSRAILGLRWLNEHDDSAFQNYTALLVLSLSPIGINYSTAGRVTGDEIHI